MSILNVDHKLTLSRRCRDVEQRQINKCQKTHHFVVNHNHVEKADDMSRLQRLLPDVPCSNRCTYQSHGTGEHKLILTSSQHPHV